MENFRNNKKKTRWASLETDSSNLTSNTKETANIGNKHFATIPIDTKYEIINS